MTGEEYILDLKSKIKVKSGQREGILRFKYGDKYDELKDKINNRDYMNEFLLAPLLQVLSKKEKEKLSTTIVDAVPLEETRAYVKKMGNQYVIIFNARLLGLISAYNEIRIVSIKDLYNLEQPKEKFSKNFAPLIDSYLTPNSGEALPIYTREQLSEAESIQATILTIAGEQFILAHELAHILLDHLELVKENQQRYKYGAHNKSQECEYAADIKALKLIKKVIKANQDNISNILPLEMHIEILVLFHLIDCNLGFPGKNSSHPSALDRLINLKNNCAVHFDQKGISFMSEMIKNCQDVESFKI